MNPSDPSFYPKLSDGTRRELIFTLIEPSTIKAFKKLGYTVVCLMTLPRGTPEEELRYLRYKARGIEEGTVDATANQLDMLRLQFKAAGLLDENRGTKEVKKEENDDIGIFDLMRDFAPSRHTTDQSTIDLVKGGQDADE